MRGRPVAVLLLLVVGACGKRSRTDGHVRAAPAHMLLLCAELEARKGAAGLRPSSRDRLGTGGCVRTGERTCGVPCCPAPQLGQHVRSSANLTPAFVGDHVLPQYGNTCYCNSVLQALYFCKPFRQRVSSYRPKWLADGEKVR